MEFPLSHQGLTGNQQHVHYQINMWTALPGPCPHVLKFSSVSWGWGWPWPCGPGLALNPYHHHTYKAVVPLAPRLHTLITVLDATRPGLTCFLPLYASPCSGFLSFERVPVSLVWGAPQSSTCFP